MARQNRGSVLITLSGEMWLIFSAIFYGALQVFADISRNGAKLSAFRASLQVLYLHGTRQLTSEKPLGFYKAIFACYKTNLVQ